MALRANGTMRFSFEVQGSTVYELERRARAELDLLAPGIGQAESPDLVIQFEIEPFARTVTGQIVSWKANVTGQFNIYAVDADPERLAPQRRADTSD